MTDARSAGPFSAWERAIALRYLGSIRKDGGMAVVSVIACVVTAIAVALLVIVMSIMNGFRSQLLDTILGFNGHIYVGGQPLVSNDRDRIVRDLEQIPGVVRVTAMVDAQAMAVGVNSNITGAIIRGVTPQDLQELKLVSGNIKRGSAEGFGQGEFGGDIILVGDRLAQAMGVDVGDTLTLISPQGDATAFGSTPRRKQYVVGGVFSVGMSEYDQAFVYMPLEQAQIFFGRDTAVDAIEIMTNDADRIDAVKPAVRRIAGDGAIIVDWREKNSSFFNALQVERSAMRLILLVIVVVAAVTTISGPIMLVNSKGSDIAILRTMGASRSAVMRIFFMSGAIIGVVGVTAGLIISVLFCLNIQEIQAFLQWVTGQDLFNADVYFFSHVPAKLDWKEVGIVTVLGVIVTFASTLYPAWRAAKLDPIKGLRYE